MIDTITIILLIQISILATYGGVEYWRFRRDQRDKKKLAKWLAARENRLSRERFWL